MFEVVNFQELIHQMVATPLSTVPFHQDRACLERFFSESFPLHLAIHCITDAHLNPPGCYTEVHSHDVDEINIILGKDGELEYLIQLGDEVFHVESYSSIYIPAGVAHAANALRGSGYYIALRLPH